MPSTLRPSIPLGIPGDPFTLFYDYDEIEEKKFKSFSPAHKIVWFRERLYMTHLEPLKRIWKDSSVFERLMHSKLDPNARCSFSVAAMGVMLGVVEALGSFRDPLTARSRDSGKNRAVFMEFLSNHMSQWSVNEPQTNTSVAEVLWGSFRNGITHDLRVDRVRGVTQLWGSLEFQENFSDVNNKRFEKHRDLLRICPLAFYDDLDVGVKDYFGQLSGGGKLLANFHDRFDEVYPTHA